MTDCQQHMHELSDTVAFIKSAAHITAPPHFEEQVMKRLPKRKNRVGIQKLVPTASGSCCCCSILLIHECDIIR